MERNPLNTLPSTALLRTPRDYIAKHYEDQKELQRKREELKKKQETKKKEDEAKKLERKRKQFEQLKKELGEQ